MTSLTRYDVVIVGARCAGATLATFLGRAGASVLLLDKERLPIDQLLSTHTIHPPGLDLLDDVGVGEAVRAVASPMHIVRLRKNDAILVGDAGHHKEFVIGDGITEALLQARSLAVAIAQGTDAALHRWWRARDVEALPYFFLGRNEGATGPPIVFSHVAKSPSLQARMAATMEHQLSPLETFSAPQVFGWRLGAAVRGSLRVIPEFIAMARQGSADNRELRLRQRLLAETEAS
jgi:menaquinone-9 beta-reductase